MGKMKEEFMRNRQEDPSEYLKDQAFRQYEGISSSNFLCPNCMKQNLLYTGDKELTCPGCGQDFIQVRKALRFK